MPLKDTILGLFRGAKQTEDIRKAEAEAAEKEMSADKADDRAELRLGARVDEFESDQESPPR